MTTPSLVKRLSAEFFGTFWLVFGGCGSAVLAAHVMHAKDPVNMGIGFVGVALAFGLTVLTMAYAVGHISGGHFNPAVTLGLAVGQRFPWKDLLPYWGAQVLGALAGSGVLYVIASGQPGFVRGGFAANGYGELSPGGYSLVAVMVCEIVCTAFFLLIIMGSTSGKAPTGFAPISIGLALTLIHLVSIPVSNTSVNPARSLIAVFAEGGYLGQVWLFWVAPLIGATIGGAIYAFFMGERTDIVGQTRSVDEPARGDADDVVAPKGATRA